MFIRQPGSVRPLNGMLGISKAKIDQNVFHFTGVFFINASHIEFPRLVKTHPTLKLKNPPTIGITVRDGHGNACGIKEKQQ